jgi:hypothetical protein
MKRLKLPPRDFGLNIRRHPNVVIEAAVRELRSRQGLEVVSIAKMRSAQQITLKLSLGNRIMETVRFLNDEYSAVHNNELVNSLFESLNNEVECNRYSPTAYPSLYIDIKEKERILGFLDVPNGVVRDFINGFKLPIQKLSDTSAKLPMRFLLEFLDKSENESLNWDISLVSGGESKIVSVLGVEYKKVKRSLELAKDGKSIKLPKNQLSIPSHEFRFLTKSQTETDNRSFARGERKIQTGKPLLLIYPIKPVAVEGEELDLSLFNSVNLWGWSVSMPGSNDNVDHISVVANSVFLKELMEDYKEELNDEDY